MIQPLELSGGRIVPRLLPAYIAGIVNVTPDSFWEKSRVPFGSPAAVNEAVELALSLAEEGCDILDIGAESTRPGAHYVTAEEEMERLIPLIGGIRRHSDIPISVDTRKASVMEAAISSGADILNDVSALEDDAALVPLCARAEIPVILMHWSRATGGEKGTLQRKSVSPSGVLAYLLERAAAAEVAGIKREKIIIDPGIGFGKQFEESRDLLRHIDIFAGKGYHIMIGVSRKSCIGKMTGRDTAGRLSGSLAAGLLAVMRGADFLRVHDVRETRDMLAVFKELSA